MRILIVRLSALGDIVHALPVLPVLRDALPDATIDWVVEARYAHVLEYVDGLSRVVRVAGARGWRPRASAMARAIAELRRQRYDVALDLQGLIKSALVARLSGARRVIGFARDLLREPQAGWLYTERAAGDRRAHIVRKNLAALAALGITPPAEIRVPLRVPPSAVADEVAAAAREAGSDRFVVVNPGGGWPNKRWEPARFGELAARIVERLRLPVFVLWGPGEDALADDVVGASRRAAARTPATSVGDVIAVAARAALVVSGDTGPLHLAAAVGTPIVGIYGPTWPQRNGPWDPVDAVISRAPACGCHHKRQCQRERRCLDDISVDNVFGAVERRLAAARRAG
ncbi:MAG: lipopolysaccharide heptosyltransferase I [Acidobacteriota bacterium]